MKYRIVLAIACLWMAGLVFADSIPAWLDDAITEFNKANPTMQIQFVDFKDSYVWYMIPKEAEADHQVVRSRIYDLVERHGYERTSDEELVTTGRPPRRGKPSKQLKCWKYSFFMSSTSDVKAMSHGQLITSMICSDTDLWYTGFRIAQ